MATATVARSAQALRNRRDARPSISKRGANALDSGTEPTGPDSKRRKLNEPYVRDTAYILQKHRGKPPSLILHLHSTHFRFDGQDGSFAYDSPMRFVIDHLRKQTVPHNMLEELWAENVPFYDGCLIVEVHNHRAVGAEKSRRAESGFSQDTVKFSMHNYNEHVTPSPLVPYPKRSNPENDTNAKTDTKDENDEDAAGKSAETAKREGPKIVTTVLHPTALSRHHELLLLAHTPASELRSRKKPGDSGTPSGGQPQTPSLSIPPTPMSAGGPRGATLQPQKMCLEEGDFYSFQSDLLVATEPPLYLEPAKTADEAAKVQEMLSHPLHNQRPPSPKIRKRTTAEMAADDAQAAEAERRMLIMDERIKPSARTGAGSAANENQSAAASLGFSRFKTLEMVRQKHEEQERVKKEEEARAAIEKRQNDEHAAQQQKLLQQNRQRELQQQQQQRHNMMMAQQNAQRPEQIRLQMEARQQQMAAREHAHPQQNNMGQQAANLQHAQATAAHSSPVARQQTPLVASSPMLANGGFSAAQPSAAVAGSPARPPSATMQNRNAAMARQASQQQHGSQSNTPQMAQGTPNMAQAIPNRQMAQTPRAPVGSPAAQLQGTPNAANMNMAGQLNPQQLAMLQQQRTNLTQGSNQQTPSQQTMTPEAIQQIRAQHLLKQQATMHAQQASQQAMMNGGDPQAAAHNAYRASMMQSLHQQQRQNQLRQQMQSQMQSQLQQQQQQQRLGGQAGSPVQVQHGGPQSTPQMNHAHPQTPFQQQQQQNRFQGQGQDMTPQQAQQAQQMAAAKAAHLQMQRQQQQLTNIAGQYGGWDHVPPNVVSSLNPQMQSMLKMQVEKQRQQRQQQMNRVHQTQQNGGDQQVPGNPNPQYMQALRANQAALMQMSQQQQNQGNAGMNGMNNMNGMGMNMNMNMGNQGNFGNMGGNHDLSQQFADLGRALGQPNNQQQQQQRNQNGNQ